MFLKLKSFVFMEKSPTKYVVSHHQATGLSRMMTLTDILCHLYSVNDPLTNQPFITSLQEYNDIGTHDSLRRDFAKQFPGVRGKAKSAQGSTFADPDLGKQFVREWITAWRNAGRSVVPSSHQRKMQVLKHLHQSQLTQLQTQHQAQIMQLQSQIAQLQAQIAQQQTQHQSQVMQMQSQLQTKIFEAEHIILDLVEENNDLREKNEVSNQEFDQCGSIDVDQDLEEEPVPHVEEEIAPQVMQEEDGRLKRRKRKITLDV
jgi:hypothetical protein